LEVDHPIADEVEHVVQVLDIDRRVEINPFRILAFGDREGRPRIAGRDQSLKFGDGRLDARIVLIKVG
jgi:hypothetical protein